MLKTRIGILAYSPTPSLLSRRYGSSHPKIFGVILKNDVVVSATREGRGAGRE